MRKKTVCLAVCLLVCASFVANGTPVGMSQLKIYSYGLSGGAMYALNDDFRKEVGENLGKVTFTNAWEFAEKSSVFGDLSWYIGGGVHGFGADFGIDFFTAPADIRPYVGVGVGAHYIDRTISTDEFNEKFGLSGTVHLGVAIDLTETVQIRVRVPFHAVLNKTQDMGVGLDVGVMFFNKFRNVKKINY